MKKLAAHLQEHKYPSILLKYPRLIHLLYRWNGLMLQRNWVTRRALKKLLQNLPPNAGVMDWGCGEGLHLLPWAKRFPQLQFTGFDRLEDHLEFGRRYASNIDLKNVHFQFSALESISLADKAALVTCIGVMQYIEEDEQVLENICRSLTSNGLALLYVPLNGRMILPLYRYFFSKKQHYEKSQKRLRVYSEDELVSKLEKAGLRVTKKKYTYGTLGILGHEIYSLMIMGMGNGGWSAPLFGLLLGFFSPLVLLLKGADFLIKKERGNGLMVIVEKNPT